jgi:hypothetical protein
MLRKDGAIEGHDLRNVCDRIIGQSRETNREKDVSGSDRPLQVSGDRDADDRCNAATIEQAPCTTTTGRRKRGSEPRGSANSAPRTSP